MKSSLKNLNAFVAQSLTPKILIANQIHEHDFICWKKFLLNEGCEFRLNLLEFLLGPDQEAVKKNLLTGIQQQLLLLSDDLNQFLVRDRRIWSEHAQAKEIRRHYLFSLNFIDELYQFITLRFPDFFNKQLRIADFHLKREIPGLRSHLKSLKVVLEKAAINTDLQQIVLKGLHSFLGDGLSPYQKDYILGLTEKLTAMDSLNDDVLEKVLIEMNFNLPEFYLHLVNQKEQRMLEINGLHEQQEFLMMEELLLLKLDRLSHGGFSTKFINLWKELGCYFTERLQAVDKMIEVRRAVMQDHVNAEHAFRILTELSVPQLALFVRVQLEVGLLLKEHVTDVFNFVAQHFYTRSTLFISSGSLMRRSTEVEFSTVLNLYDMLVKMTTWLDEKFSVSNFKR
jgi:hypothetical protein